MYEAFSNSVQSNKLSYFGLVRFELSSHSFFASSESLAREVGSALLQSIKYSPDIPLTCGCNAT